MLELSLPSQPALMHFPWTQTAEVSGEQGVPSTTCHTDNIHYTIGLFLIMIKAMTLVLIEPYTTNWSVETFLALLVQVSSNSFFFIVQTYFCPALIDLWYLHR